MPVGQPLQVAAAVAPKAVLKVPDGHLEGTRAADETLVLGLEPNAMCLHTTWNQATSHHFPQLPNFFRVQLEPDMSLLAAD